MPQHLLLVNPAKRRRAKSSRTERRRNKNKTQHVAGYYPNPVKRRRVRRSKARKSSRRVIRFHRNPIGGRSLFGGMQSTLVNGAIGAAGGVAVDALLKLAPVSLKTGPVSHLTRAGAAIALGMLGNMVKLPFAGALAQGAMTIALYGAAREYVTVPMGLSEYTDNDVAEIAGLAYDSPAQLVDGVDGVDAYQPIEPALVGEYEETY